VAELTQNSYFGDVPERLQRALDLDGIIRLKLQDALQPTVKVSDGTRPGYAGGVRGRSWAKGFAGLASGSAYYLMAPVGGEGFEIETLAFVATGSASPNGDLLSIFQYAPGGAAFPFTPAGTDTEFVERYANDIAPIISGSSAAAQTKTTSFNVPMGLHPVVLPVRIFVPPGNLLAFRWVAAGVGALTLTVLGRTF
jgi:hypothetical protein